jgi:hypothetical protein
MTRESAIERAQRQIPRRLPRCVVLWTKSQVRESRPPLGIYFERGTAPAFQCMVYATESLLYVGAARAGACPCAELPWPSTFRRYYR